MRYFKLLMFVLLSLAVMSCKEHEDSEVGDVIVNFRFVADGSEIRVDTLAYFNSAGNHYSVADLKMLVSDFTVQKSTGETYTLEGEQGVHYVDIRDENTLSWHISDVPSGVYGKIGFTFGVDSALNKTGRFVNPPISNLLWPENIGGGYHYLMLNCRWHSELLDVMLPLNFHLGNSIEYDLSVLDTLIMDNSVPLLFDNDFEITPDFDNEFNVVVNVNNWFSGQYVIDFEKLLGVSIMESQALQMYAKANGANVFHLTKEVKR